MNSPLTFERECEQAQAILRRLARRLQDAEVKIENNMWNGERPRISARQRDAIVRDMQAVEELVHQIDAATSTGA